MIEYNNNEQPFRLWRIAFFNPGCWEEWNGDVKRFYNSSDDVYIGEWQPMDETCDTYCYDEYITELEKKNNKISKHGIKYGYRYEWGLNKEYPLIEL